MCEARSSTSTSVDVYTSPSREITRAAELQTRHRRRHLVALSARVLANVRLPLLQPPVDVPRAVVSFQILRSPPALWMELGFREAARRGFAPTAGFRRLIAHGDRREVFSGQRSVRDVVSSRPECVVGGRRQPRLVHEGDSRELASWKMHENASRDVEREAGDEVDAHPSALGRVECDGWWSAERHVLRSLWRVACDERVVTRVREERERS